jgi:uridine kinase
MVPAHPSVRSPVLLFIGGGMGAGKSTVVQEHILKSAFWSGVAHNAVIVEADAFKETDVIYRTLNAMGQDDVASTAELVI